MTLMSDEPEEVAYPTDWHMIDSFVGIESRQLSFDTYQLRSSSHTITLNTEGFNLYRDNSPQGQVIFDNWCERNHIIAIPYEAPIDD